MDLLGQNECGTTYVVLPVEQGILVATCSRLTTRDGRVVHDNAMKFRLVTSIIGVVMSGLYERFEAIHHHLLNWVSNNPLPPPTVDMLAKVAENYMSLNKAVGQDIVSLLFVGHDYVSNSLVHSIICVADEPAPIGTPCTRIYFKTVKENFFVGGSGQMHAVEVLNSLWPDKMGNRSTHDVLKLSLLNPALKDPKTGGILRFFYMSPLCQTLPMSDVYDSYIEKFDEFHTANQNAIFILCADGKDNDPLLSFKFSQYGHILYKQCLSKNSSNSFHRIQYVSWMSVQKVLSESTNVQIGREPFCHFQRILIIAPNGSSSYAYISMAVKFVLKKVKDYMGPVAFDSNP